MESILQCVRQYNVIQNTLNAQDFIAFLIIMSVIIDMTVLEEWKTGTAKEMHAQVTSDVINQLCASPSTVFVML